METIDGLRDENALLKSALKEACKILYCDAYCCNRGHCNNLNVDCVKCLEKHFIQKGFVQLRKQNDENNKKKVKRRTS